MWELIELREIRVFLVLADELHFGRTAERLGLTQSRVSQSLRGFERKLGMKLFERTSRRVALTADGERLRDAVSAPYDGLTGVLRATAEVQRPSPVRLGASDAASIGARLLAVIDDYERGAPGRAVQIVELPAGEMLDLLRRGAVDVIIARLPVDDPEFVVGPVMEHEARVLAVASAHPLAKRSTVSVDDIAEHDVGWADGAIPRTSEAFFPSRTPAGRPVRRVRLGINDVSELIVAIARGKIVHPTISSFASHHGHPGVAYVPITDLPPALAALVWRREVPAPALREFIAVARSARPATQPRNA
jgi:DNA-binding transcriptional LysR family regulator